jgi:hypothetical protein
MRLPDWAATGHGPASQTLRRLIDMLESVHIISDTSVPLID